MIKLLKTFRVYLLIITCMLLLYSVFVFISEPSEAWLTDTSEMTAEFQIGMLDFDVATLKKGETKIDNIILNGGTKIHMKNATEFEDPKFNEMVYHFVINLKNTGTIPIRISSGLVASNDNGPGVMYMVVPSDVVIDKDSDFRTIILNQCGITNSTTPFSAQLKGKLDLHNAQMFAESSANIQEVLVNSQKKVNVLVWADYDMLKDFTPTVYQEQTVEFIYKVNSIQKGGDAPPPNIVAETVQEPPVNP